MMVLLTKIVSSADLKTSTLLAKRLILDASLGPEPASVDEYIAVLKTQTKICKDGRQVKMKSFYPVPFSRIFARKILCKLLSKHLWQSLFL